MIRITGLRYSAAMRFLLALLAAFLLTSSQAVRPAGPALFIGDSITKNWDTQKLLPHATNAGRAGEGIHQMHKRTIPQMQTLRPGLVHILAGTNDPLDIKARRTIGKVLAVAFAAREAGANTIVIGTIPPIEPGRYTLQPPDVQRYNFFLKILTLLCGFKVVDYHAAMSGPNGQFRPELFADGIHPNAKGYEVMQQALADELDIQLIPPPH